MSKIGRLPIKLPSDTTLSVADSLITVKGKLGELRWQLPQEITIQQQDGIVTVVNQHPNDPTSQPIYGLTRAKLSNMVKGVSVGFERILEIIGVGFRAELKDDELWLHLGFSRPVKLNLLPGVTVKIVKNEVTISGIDKEMVGEMAARIRATKKPEPYKGKGIKYQGEIIRRKQGKAAKTAAS